MKCIWERCAGEKREYESDKEMKLFPVDLQKISYTPWAKKKRETCRFVEII
jgi:hypothetical protein